MAVKKTGKVKVCVIGGCSAEAKSRGLCQNHYQSACKAVESEATTWAEMEKLGVSLPPKPKSNGFIEFLTKKRGTAPVKRVKSRASAPKKVEAQAEPTPEPVAA